ncbi:MAG: hypothetical protein EZS28_051729, partial [Streblomastix strix]
MESLDIASTISSYIKTGPDNDGYINIPSNNLGIARNLFERASDNLRAKKQSLASMLNLYDETKNEWMIRGMWRKNQILNLIDERSVIVNNIRKFVYNESIYDVSNTIQDELNIDENGYSNEGQLSEQIKQIIDSNSETVLKSKAQEEAESNGIYKKALSHYKHIKEQAENANVQLFQAIKTFDIPTSQGEVYWSYLNTYFLQILLAVVLISQFFFVDMKVM